MKHPTLYKKTSTGAIQEWTISVTANTIRTKFGQLNGKIQTTEDTITKGKNIGKANETTVSQQALAEAEASWIKKKKKGYVESIIDAGASIVDKVIQGGIEPMLAQSFAKHGDKITYPCYVQPKLDGIRCIAVIEDGICTLWSRTRKPITSVPHIIEALEQHYTGNAILDGELYNHKFKNNFEHIVHLVRQEEPCDGYEDVEYHIYDDVSDSPFSERWDVLEIVHNTTLFSEKIVLVETTLINSDEEVQEYFDKYKKQKYEGAMLRNANSLYANKRSYDLQKVKEFEDAEFEIVGVEEGRGKLQGHVGAFVCQTSKGKQFKAKPEGSLSNLKRYFENHKLWKGKQLTVRYQGLTGKEKVPRFPVGVAIRDYE